MSRIGFHELNFQKNISQIEAENQKEFQAILQNENLQNLETSSSNFYKETIKENCKKILPDIQNNSSDSVVSNDFVLNLGTVKGKEKEIEAFKNKWNSCVQKYKEIDIDKNNSMSNLEFINDTFFGFCIDDCKVIRSAKGQKNCLSECFSYHKLNSSVNIKLKQDIILKYLNNLKIV